MRKVYLLLIIMLGLGISGLALGASSPRPGLLNIFSLQSQPQTPPYITYRASEDPEMGKRGRSERLSALERNIERLEKGDWLTFEEMCEAGQNFSFMDIKRIGDNNLFVIDDCTSQEKSDRVRGYIEEIGKKNFKIIARYVPKIVRAVYLNDIVRGRDGRVFAIYYYKDPKSGRVIRKSTQIGKERRMVVPVD